MENTFLVGRRGDNVVKFRPAVEMSEEEAANLAAWLLAMMYSTERVRAIYYEITGEVL